MTPLIGILASLWLAGEGLHAGDERFFASRDYTAAILKAGGTPVILPWAGDPAVILRQLRAVHGLLLIGGYDVDPLLYGDEPSPRLGPVFPERDEYEIMAVKLACLMGKPILGICRGIQLINVAFGGTLWQDLALRGKPQLQHYQDCQRDVAGHSVELGPGTVLAEILGPETLRTNSYHHQAVKDPAPGFSVSARAKDGVIEGIEKREAGILAVQWHPEMMLERFPAMLGIFRWLAESAASAADLASV
ncbi:MAG: gamma-glutamyl-gamma-aminobutyrate hydrolase family protein [Negativicutes bacterium]|nr:gamma-glutamyl-gamma-aminobutyrate hydrolase family protein [Negativicutes bacterium]